MRIIAVFFWLLVGACANPEAPSAEVPHGPVGKPPPGVPSGAELCKAYASIPNAHAWCIYRNIRTVRAYQAMLDACAQAGAWTDDCRQEWVHIQLSMKSEVSREQLLEACGGNEDCALVVLDTLPLPEPLAQMELCARHAPNFASSCAGHALERWWATRPTQEELRRVAEASTSFPNEVGRILGASSICRKAGECRGDAAMVPWCEQWAAKFTADPRGCPP
jgi:hypothetical protein